MKLKILVLFFVIISESGFLYSQVIKDYGVKLGFSSSNIVVKNEEPITIDNNKIMLDYPSGQLVSPTISAWVKIVENKILNVELEASYLQKGLCETEKVAVTDLDKPDGTGEMEDYKFTETFEYIDIHINEQFKYQFAKVIPYLIIGPAVSYLLNSENFLLEKNGKKDFIFGYNLGIGIDLSELTGRNIFVEAKYNGDFSDFYKTGHADFWNRVWIFDIGIRI